MAIILAASGLVPNPTTTTVQNILDSASQDVRKVLDSTNGDGLILLDYCNRVSLDLLRASRWKFLLSAPQLFITKYGQTDYWLGPTGQNPAGSTDTGLNLSDIGLISEAQVGDESNFTSLARVQEQPLLVSYAFQDGSSRIARPIEWRNAVDTPYIINLYPAPDNANGYQPTPLPPNVETVTSGALAARTYYVKVSFVDSAGNESAASLSTKVYVPASKLLKVKAPKPSFPSSASGILYNKYKVYASTTLGAEQLQTVTAQSTGSDWTEPGSGLISGVAFPTVNGLEVVGGYIVAFRYYKRRVQLTSAQQVLQIPDDYKDVVTAGVNFYACSYLRLSQETQLWGQMYQGGLKSIIGDKNLFPHGQQDYIRPDTMYSAS